jgi:hypothetical protein
MSADPGDRREEELTRDAMNHAWNWFALHAGQRMQMVNFFLLAVAFLVTGYVAALTKDLHAGAVGIGLLGAWIALSFHRLELRTKELVKAGEAAMKDFERRLAEKSGVQELEIVKRVEKTGKNWTSYGKVLPTLHWTIFAAFLAGSVYALYLGGVRFCLMAIP